MAARHDTALQEIPRAEPVETLGGRVALRYVARAGLLPELSRQTYDSFPKALREAVLNSLDAEATRVDIDFSRVESDHELSVIDDGNGMSMREFCEQFMSLGGSSRFGDATRFGRIGIGSLALLQYAQAATVETKRAGATTGTRARLEHPWALQREQRRVRLGELTAGFAEEFSHDGAVDDHFTRVRLEGVNPDVWAIGQDPTAFYRVLDDLRRILPLTWQDSRLTEALERVSPELVALLTDHVREWSAPVYAHSSWERDIEMRRRFYGDDQAKVEEWSGPPTPVLKKIRLPGDGRRRQVIVAGFLLNQKRANPGWSGLTARVQNVAVEQHSFFDVTSDPGFRKYITGEVWLLGDIDRERLINIDRSSFNRECTDYQAVQRFMGRAIVDFKSASVQRPQRQKVAVRRALEDHIRTLRAIEKVAQRAVEIRDEQGERGLPSSEPGRGSVRKRSTIIDKLSEVQADVVIDEGRARDDLSYSLDVSDDGRGVRATIGPGVAKPRLRVGSVEYRVAYAAADEDDPPVLIRNRPREIIFNTSHPVHTSGEHVLKYQLSLALELAYLLDSSDAAGVYERMVSFMEAL
jgi:Histidine kinase-, DNA gyrase B-, and HSP90-like ATPase